MSADGALPDLNRGFVSAGEALPDLNRGFVSADGASPELNRGFVSDGGALPDEDSDLIEAFDLLSPRVRRLFACGANSLYLCGV
ncbi:hypothetical protein T231_15715 [Tannerella sp. oral taxon BU063 isolate Cell 6/7/9]|uniref:Uncharacterized protein n=1 Tax=Tannerella sp. oral taxon BU063 isolate Cell 6/7/9 TaxID=1411021 RepID=W2CMN2_9BACT|nr:hypothetical protein T231_15715 [Tannerella sp. oral taxon BU063 isolate Cell 6/7/9]